MDNNDRQENIKNAISNLDFLIKKHEKSSRIVAGILVSFMFILFVSGFYLYTYQLKISSDVSEKISPIVQEFIKQVRDINSSKQSANPSCSDLSRDIKLQLTSAEVVSLRDKNVLIFSFAIFTLVFGVLMAIYRHHLVEISKCQYFRIAFMRIEAATDDILNGEDKSVLKASLADRAFDYRSGKEKKVEGPLPGYPASDTTTAIINRLLEVLEPKNRA